MILYVDLRDDKVVDPGWGQVGQVISRYMDTADHQVVTKIVIELDPKDVRDAQESHQRSPVF